MSRISAQPPGSVGDHAGEVAGRLDLLAAIDALPARDRECLQLAEWEQNVRPGTTLGSGQTIARLADRPDVRRAETAREAVEQIAFDLTQFKEAHRLDQVVVLNVSSTEPPFETGDAHSSMSRLAATLDRRPPALPASSIYAYAAIHLGMSYVNFTPSLGATIPSLEELAVAPAPCPLSPALCCFSTAKIGPLALM